MTASVLFINNTHNTLNTSPNIDTWIRLAEYKDHPHPKGLQRLNYTAGEEIVKQFDSLKSRLCRTFVGVPIYVGHPDDPEFAGRPGHGDTKAYGWVKALEARDDGLWFYPKWSAAGRELLENAFYRFTSPRWTLKPLGSGVFQPIKLISIGLTNQPNLQCDAIANEKAQEILCGIEDLAGALGLSSTESISPQLASELKTFASNIDEERAHWHQERQALQSKIDSFEKAANSIQPLSLNTQSITHNLPNTDSSSIDHLVKQVRNKMSDTGCDYLEAWGQVMG